jgi:hypothetical protein
MMRLAFMATRTLATFMAIAILLSIFARAQSRTNVTLQMPHSYNPLKPYVPDKVPAPALANSSRIDHLVRDGKLYLTLKDAIALALENNLDLAIARYNIPIADTDLLRTKAGGFFRGVNTGVVQGTPGGGVGGYGAGAPGAGAGGTTGGAGGAGAGASGLVQSTHWARARRSRLTIRPSMRILASSIRPRLSRTSASTAFRLYSSIQRRSMLVIRRLSRQAPR